MRPVLQKRSAAQHSAAAASTGHAYRQVGTAPRCFAGPKLLVLVTHFPLLLLQPAGMTLGTLLNNLAEVNCTGQAQTHSLHRFKQQAPAAA